MGLAQQPGNQVTLSYRKEVFSRIKERNAQHIEECIRAGRVNVLENAEARLEMGRDLYETGDVTGALEQTNLILTKDPKNVDALYNAGAICANANKPGVARDYWKRTVASGPNSESGKRAAEGLERLREPGQ
jgi:hypothetical protein